MFVVGTEYLRSDLLDFVGSRQGQSGIIWGHKQPDVVLCTSGGRHGAGAGYDDGIQPDGSWHYFGQGERGGGQDPRAFANRLLIEGQRTVLLFTTKEPTAAEVSKRGNSKKRYVYVGAYCSGAWDVIVPVQGKRMGHSLLRFTILPALDRSGSSARDLEQQEDRRPWRSLRTQALKNSRPVPLGTLSVREYLHRSSLITRYARGRAEGSCECCDGAAPFRRIGGEPFLEVHHILRLVDDGPDAPANVAAIFPNCHREAHHGLRASEIRGTLLQKIRAKEAALDRG